MTMAQILPIPTVTLVEDRPATTSLAIAEHFGKRHDDVLKSIRRLCTELPAEKRARNFAETFRTVAGPNNSERQELFFTVYFDGFILLVMGYTGKKALQIKLAYIDAFNAMREELEGRQASPTTAPEPSPISRRTDPERKALTAIINTWVGMAPIHYAAARAQVNAHLGVASVDAMTVAQVKEAIQYVQGKIDALPAAPAALPPASGTAEVEAHLATIRAHAREIMDCERSLYFALRDTLPPLRGVSRPLTLRLHENMDSGFGLLDAALRQVENTARLVLEYARS